MAPRSDVSDITHYAYDASGNLTTVTNALGQVTTLTYTPQGWLASSSVAGSTTQFAYNAVGDPPQIMALYGSILSYTYDETLRTEASDTPPARTPHRMGPRSLFAHQNCYTHSNYAIHL